jgi:hypothetical protein
MALFNVAPASPLFKKETFALLASSNDLITFALTANESCVMMVRVCGPVGWVAVAGEVQAERSKRINVRSRIGLFMETF